MNQRPGTALPSSPVSSFQRWRLQIFAITWLAYAAFYFTRKGLSVAKLGIAEDPGFQLDKMAMADLDAIYLAAYAVGQFTWGVLADRFGPRIVVFGGLLISALAALVMGTFATLPIFATCMVVQDWRSPPAGRGCARTSAVSSPPTNAVGCSACGAPATPSAAWSPRRSPAGGRTAWSRYLARGVLLQRRGGRRRGPAVPAVAAQPPGRRRPSSRRTAGRERSRALCRLQAGGGNGGSLQVLAKVVRNRTVLCLGLAYFLLKPARYAILLWGPVIVYERMPALGKVGAAIVPTAFEVAGLLGPILIGFASDKLFGARRMPACVDQPAGADRLPGAVRPGDDHRQHSDSGRPAVHDGTDPALARTR